MPLPALALAKLLPWKWIVGALVLVAATLTAVAWHAKAKRDFAHAHETIGETRERALWQTEMARLKAEHELRRQSDEAKLRAIGLALTDTRAQLRSQRDDFESDMQRLEVEDAAAGAAPNDFDARVLRLVR